MGGRRFCSHRSCLVDFLEVKVTLEQLHYVSLAFQKESSILDIFREVDNFSILHLLLSNWNHSRNLVSKSHLFSVSLCRPELNTEQVFQALPENSIQVLRERELFSYIRLLSFHGPFSLRNTSSLCPLEF